jgi:poly(A) polymerase/tRNA nucleotidyltransferase (CCA-adding enzyme)
MSVDTLLGTPGLSAVFSALPQARLVGGCVRDMLVGREVADIDLATPDPPEAVLLALEGAGLRAIPTGLSHGTVTAISEGRPFEITTLRRDEESFGRHARVSWTDDFLEDAARRDFTINAMSLDRDGVLHDYFGGAADLQAGRVRFVGDASLRVTEDYLRCLRYFRFFARYGQGQPDADAVAAITAGKAGLASLSAERVWSEVKRIFGAPDPRAALAVMARVGVLAAVLPEAGDVAAVARLVEAGAPADPLLRLAALLDGDAGDVGERLKFSGAERERLGLLLHGKVPAADDDDSALRRLLADEPATVLLDRLWLSGGYSAGFAARIASMPRPVFPLEGRDALALGALPGPHVGEALRRVRAWWMAGGCVASAEAARERLAIELSGGG